MQTTRGASLPILTALALGCSTALSPGNVSGVNAAVRTNVGESLSTSGQAQTSQARTPPRSRREALRVEVITGADPDDPVSTSDKTQTGLVKGPRGVRRIVGRPPSADDDLVLARTTGGRLTMSSEVRILDLNIAGAAMQKGGDFSEYLLYKIRQIDANVVTLQEVCSTQASAVANQLHGWSMFFKKNTTDDICGGSKKFGLATFVKGAISDPSWWELPYSNPVYGWSKYLTKVTWNGYNVYNTHIRAFGGGLVRNTAQFDFVVSQLRGRVLLAGDFNAIGRTIQGLSEIDADAERTHSSGKIDYIFTTGKPLWGDAQDSISNHRILRGSIR